MLRPTRNTLPEAIRAHSVELLNAHLAATLDLHAQLKHAHWNVRGSAFIAVHELFDKIAGEAEEWSDLIAERAAQLGGTAHGTVQVAAARSFLIVYPLGIASSDDHLFAVAGALAAFGQRVREAADEAVAFGDADTSDVLTGVSRSAISSFGWWRLIGTRPARAPWPTG